MVKKSSKKSPKRSRRGNKTVQVSKRDSFAIVIVALAVLLAFFYPGITAEKPVRIELLHIVSDSCSDCFDITSLSDGFQEQLGVETLSSRSIQFDSSEAKSLIEKHGIKTVPALIIRSSKISELPSNEILEIDGDVGVFQRSVPYFDLESNRVRGIVNLIEVRSTCGDECPKAEQVRIQLESLGVVITPSQIIDEATPDGKSFVEEAGLSFTPAVILSKEIEEYWWVFPQISEAFVKKGEEYVFKSPVPPYKDVESQEVKGKVSVTYLLDETCENCFNPLLMKRSFEDFGVYFNDEKTVDVASTPGKALLIKYNITKVPTAIFSKDISEYVPLTETLNNLGSFEKIDQSFVIRNIEALQANYNEVSP